MNILEVADGNVVKIVRSQTSTLVADGEVVLPDDKLQELGALMWHVEANYPVDTEGRDTGDGEREIVLLDMEFKVESDGSLAIKQIRPLLISSTRQEWPTFELVIPAGAEACGRMNLRAPSGDPKTEYDSKSVVRFRAGTLRLPTDRCVFTEALFEEVLVGPGQEVATPDGPGVFRVSLRPSGSGAATVFDFDYKQTFSLAAGRSFEINVFNLEFAVRDGVSVEPTIVLDDEYITFDLAMRGFSDDSELNVTYSSCEYSQLPAWDMAFVLEDGMSLRLLERFLPSEDLTTAGPASLGAAELRATTLSRRVTSYWELVYASGRHNAGVKYWIVLDPPLTLPDLDGVVHVLELKVPDRPDVTRLGLVPQPGGAAYLDENFDVLAELELVSYAKVQAKFIRGDANRDETINISDAIRVLDRLFRGGAQLVCPSAADANDDGAVTITDAVWTLRHLFHGLPLPAPSSECGADPTPDELHCDRAGGCF